MLRLAVDSAIALMLVAILGGVLWRHSEQLERMEQVQRVQHAMWLIENRALYHGATGEVETTPSGYPKHVSPGWFDRVPVNELVGARRQWIEVAGDADYARTDPREIVARAGRAAFWYNPHLGVLRARVPRQLSDRATLELYNLVNGRRLALEQLHEPGPALSAVSSDELAR